MPEAAHQVDFLLEALANFQVAKKVLVNGFDNRVLGGLLVPNEKDLPHAAFTQHLDDVVIDKPGDFAQWSANGHGPTEGGTNTCQSSLGRNRPGCQ
jgi:hypothetical protein